MGKKLSIFMSKFYDFKKIEKKDEARKITNFWIQEITK